MNEVLTLHGNVFCIRLWRLGDGEYQEDYVFRDRIDPATYGEDKAVFFLTRAIREVLDVWVDDPQCCVCGEGCVLITRACMDPEDAMENECYEYHLYDEQCAEERAADDELDDPIPWTDRPAWDDGPSPLEELLRLRTGKDCGLRLRRVAPATYAVDRFALATVTAWGSEVLENLDRLAVGTETVPMSPDEAINFLAETFRDLLARSGLEDAYEPAEAMA